MASVKLVRVGVAPDAARCTAAKPVDLKICAATAACVTHGWEAPAFSARPAVVMEAIQHPGAALPASSVVLYGS